MRNLIGSGGSGRIADDFIPTPLSTFWVEVSSAATLVPIPEGARFAVFSFPDGNYGVHYGTDTVEAEIPSSSGVPTNLSDWCPSQRLLNPSNTHMSIIGTDAHVGMVSFYS